MSKKALLLGAIASIIAINSVFADTTVTSKAYVDNQDNAIYNYVDEELQTKQDLIETDEDTWTQRSGGGHQYMASAPLATFDGDLWQGNQYQVFERIVNDPENHSADQWATLEPFLTEEWQPAGWATVPTTYTVAQAIQAVKNAGTMTCAGYPDGVPHTDENCWLWRKN